MTAHIDDEQLEEGQLECGDCDPHDCHALRRLVNDLKRSRTAWIFFFCVSVFFNAISFYSLAVLRGYL